MHTTAEAVSPSIMGIAASFFYMLSWLVLAVAFAVLTKRCWAGTRPVAITALLTCVAALLSGAALELAPSVVTLNRVFTLTFIALIAFGITAHRPFGGWWSVPATVAGLLGLSPYLFGYYLYSSILSLLWLIPLLILGIAMCRTRIEPPATS